MRPPLRILLLAGPTRDADELMAAVQESLRAEGESEALLLRADDDVAIELTLHGERPDLVLWDARSSHAWRETPSLGDRLVDQGFPVIVVADSLEVAMPDALRWGASVCLAREGTRHLRPALARARRDGQRRSEWARTTAFETGQREILEHIAAGAPLAEVLEKIVLFIEAQADGMFGSILLLDGGARRLRNGASPHLPHALIEGIEGAEIGPTAGSCGAAACLGHAIFVEDVATHPHWARHRHLALPYGLRACWSSPICTDAGEIVGTFALYYGKARGPNAREKLWVERATHLAAIALARGRAIRDQPPPQKTA